MVSLSLQPPATPPVPSIAPSIEERQSVRILHPAYSAPNNVLLELPATDGTQADHGIHAMTVLTACAIVANNRFDGQLLTPSGTLVAPLGNDDGSACITAGEYLFQVPSDPEYAIVPKFRAWSFPHEAIPMHWKQIASKHKSSRVNIPAAAQVFARDSACRLTAHQESNELAHIIPDSETTWFDMNNMGRYGVNNESGQLKSAWNMMLLRADVHNLWDRRTFSMVPKRDTTDDGSWSLVAHCMSSSDEIHTIYHNRPLLPTLGVPAACWIARFAWDIFPKLIFFLVARRPRRLVIRYENGQIEEREYDADECIQFCQGQGRGRSVSPTKRQRVGDGSSTHEEREATLPVSIDSAVSQLDGYDSTGDGMNRAGLEDESESDGEDMYGISGEARRQQQIRLWNAGRLNDDAVSPDENDYRKHSPCRGRKRKRV